MLTQNKRNSMFVAWYEDTGCGWQNCIGKTEEGKMEIAFVEGMREGRREVAESIAEMFGIMVSHDEADRFIRALDKVIEAWEEEIK